MVVKKKTARRRVKASARRTKRTTPGAATASKRMRTRRTGKRAAAASKSRQTMQDVGTYAKAERVVVDEIMENGRARILRAPRLPGKPDTDLGIDTWGDEVEDAITVTKLEAYVGFTVPRRLTEGDVFFVRDGSTLSEAYKGRKVIGRAKAAEKHLITEPDESREEARKEIKERFFSLTAQRAGRNQQDRRDLFKVIRARVWKGSR